MAQAREYSALISSENLMKISEEIDALYSAACRGDDLLKTRIAYDKLMAESPFIAEHVFGSETTVRKLRAIPNVLKDKEWLAAKKAAKREADQIKILVETGVQRFFETEFLNADELFDKALMHAELITPVTGGIQAGYEKMKSGFVKTWISDNSHPNNGKERPALDDEQASAIAAVNGHVQVVARAGSGKTTTLVNRTLFLMKHCGVAPSQMLLLAFNRKAVLEIRRRLLGLLSEGAEAAVVEEIARRRREAAQKNRSARDDIEVDSVDTIATKLNVALPYVMTFHALARSIANFVAMYLCYQCRMFGSRFHHQLYFVECACHGFFNIYMFAQPNGHHGNRKMRMIGNTYRNSFYLATHFIEHGSEILETWHIRKCF